MGYFLGKSFFDDCLNAEVTHAYHAISIDEERSKFSVSLWDEEHLAPHQQVVQVWFPGVHSDVGGSYDERGLSDTALIWMLDNAQHIGLRLKDGWQDAFAPDPLGELHQSRKGLWRLWRPAPREIPEGANVHESVIHRAKQDPDYNPRLPERYTVVS